MDVLKSEGKMPEGKDLLIRDGRNGRSESVHSSSKDVGMRSGSHD